MERTRAKRRQRKPKVENLELATPLYDEVGMWNPDRPWLRLIARILGEGTREDLAVVGSLIALTYIGLKVIEYGDRLSTGVLWCVIGIAFLIGLIGASAFWRRSNAKNRKREPKKPPDARHERADAGAAGSTQENNRG